MDDRPQSNHEMSGVGPASLGQGGNPPKAFHKPANVILAIEPLDVEVRQSPPRSVNRWCQVPVHTEERIIVFRNEGVSIWDNTSLSLKPGAKPQRRSDRKHQGFSPGKAMWTSSQASVKGPAFWWLTFTNLGAFQ